MRSPLPQRPTEAAVNRKSCYFYTPCGGLFFTAAGPAALRFFKKSIFISIYKVGKKTPEVNFKAFFPGGGFLRFFKKNRRFFIKII
jgi:hypothetical protein